MLATPQLNGWGDPSREDSMNQDESFTSGNASSNANDENDSPGPEFNNKRIILQKFTIYNSALTMYIVGSNAKESLFRIIEISSGATIDDPLGILEDTSYFYTRKDMIELIHGLDESIEGGIHRIAQAAGLVGLIKFTKGYYLSIITKCSQVAVIGGHFVYHVDETKLIPLEFNYRRPEKYSDEEKLLSIFKYLDLGKTFYFSYTYDLTNSLQTNFLRYKKAANDKLRQHEEDAIFGHNERFVWNNLLLDPVLKQSEIATYEWFQPIIHGFIDQANISIYGRKIYITIIARRSHHFAGARFLKRGVNDRGNVANEVETEQIVSDMLTTSFHDPKYGFFSSPRFTSFVQHRGSIPLYWTQDLNRLPKPPIEINLSDPFYQSSALHFNNLFKRYGLPIIILNLIKTKEKQPRELNLNMHFENCIKYLNQFLPLEKKLKYYSFDMSKHSKKNLDVIGPLQEIAKSSIARTGFFHNGVTTQSTKIQRGIVRTNCIDCLDRTNAAQFIICKEALSYQLQSLGFISRSTDLDYDSDLINILTEIFHDHGDTIAVQYGGSNLVNTMDSYRRINQWSSHTRDILNSIKRIYSNSFMDLIRQEAINLFLGNYIYDPNTPKLWELQNDYYLHNNNLVLDFRTKVSYQRWYNEQYLKVEHTDKQNPQNTYYAKDFAKLESFPEYNDNWFNECYVPRKYQSFANLFQFNMNSNVRYFPSNSNTTPKNFDYSPFESRKPYFKNRGSDNLETFISVEVADSSEKQCEPTTSEQSKSQVSHSQNSNLPTSPKKFRSFITTRIHSLRTPNQTGSNLQISEVSSITSAVRDENIELEIETSQHDIRLYSEQFHPPMMPTVNYTSYARNILTSRMTNEDNKLYSRTTLRIPSDQIRASEPTNIQSSDIKLYWQYLDQINTNNLETQDNYFY